MPLGRGRPAVAVAASLAFSILLGGIAIAILSGPVSWLLQEGRAAVFSLFVVPLGVLFVGGWLLRLVSGLPRHADRVHAPFLQTRFDGYGEGDVQAQFRDLRTYGAAASWRTRCCYSRRVGTHRIGHGLHPDVRAGFPRPRGSGVASPGSGLCFPDQPPWIPWVGMAEPLLLTTRGGPFAQAATPAPVPTRLSPSSGLIPIETERLLEGREHLFLVGGVVPAVHPLEIV